MYRCVWLAGILQPRTKQSRSDVPLVSPRIKRLLGDSFNMHVYGRWAWSARMKTSRHTTKHWWPIRCVLLECGRSKYLKPQLSGVHNHIPALSAFTTLWGIGWCYLWIHVKTFSQLDRSENLAMVAVAIWSRQYIAYSAYLCLRRLFSIAILLATIEAYSTKNIVYWYRFVFQSIAR